MRRKQSDMQEILALYQQFSPEQKSREALLNEQVLSAAQQRAFAQQLQPEELARLRITNEGLGQQNMFEQQKQPLQLAGLAQALSQATQQQEQQAQMNPVLLEQLREQLMAGKLENQLNAATLNPKIQAGAMLPDITRAQRATGQAQARQANAQAGVAQAELSNYGADRMEQSGMRKAQILSMLSNAAPQTLDPNANPLQMLQMLSGAVGLPMDMGAGQSAQADPLMAALAYKQQGDPTRQLAPNDLDQLLQSGVQGQQLSPEVLNQLLAHAKAKTAPVDAQSAMQKEQSAQLMEFIMSLLSPAAVPTGLYNAYQRQQRLQPQ